MKTSWISPFIEGLQSVIDVSGRVKGVISSSVADGVESGFNRITPRLVRLGVVVGLFFVGLLLFALGLGTVLENALRLPGLGYLLTGVMFVVSGALYYAYGR